MRITSSYVAFIGALASSRFSVYASRCEENLGDAVANTLDKTEWFKITQGYPRGRDDGVNFLVAGDYTCQAGAEIEGVAVTLGNFHVKKNGLSNVGVVGAGSQVAPNDGKDSWIVGGDLTLDKFVDYMSRSTGNVVIGGQKKGTGSLGINGLIKENASINFKKWRNLFDNLKVKSDYWATLQANGVWKRANGYDNLVFSAVDDNELQVFSVPTEKLTHTNGFWVVFDKSLKDKTILINVNADIDGVVNVKNIADMVDPYGNQHWGFEPKSSANIFWNFHDATTVNLGTAQGGGSGEFQGNILISTPDAEVRMSLPGTSGRFIVNGNVLHDRKGSEFHNYPFQPPTPLPLPPQCDETSSPIVSLTDSPTESPTYLPTKTTTDSPTDLLTKSPTDSPSKKTDDNFFGASGDPHFMTWGRDKFDFHGICDLVLLSNPSFDNGNGLDIHIRNKKMRMWSYIETAAIRIGENIFEAAGGNKKDEFWINGVVQSVKNNNGEKFSDDIVVGNISGYNIEFTRVSEKSCKYVIDIGINQDNNKREAIVFKTWHSFVSINVQNPTKEYFNGSVGLLGSFPLGIKLARDGKTTFEDISVFGQEWQVQSSEPRLFLKTGSVKPSDKCSSPSNLDMRRRLVESEMTLKEAKIACTYVDDEMMDLCIFDVMATNDISSSGIY